jgi:hypothetical protein
MGITLTYDEAIHEPKTQASLFSEKAVDSNQDLSERKNKNVVRRKGSIA